MEHGGEAAGPVVRDIVKAFYDKKTARTQQQAKTFRSHRRPPTNGGPSAASVVPAQPQKQVGRRQCRRAAPMKDRPQIQDFDWVLLGIVAAINALGVLEIYSSTHASAMAGMQWKQMMWIGIGFVGMFLISRVDYHTLLDQAPILYIAGVLGLIVVLVIGFSRLGAKRWISLGGGVNFQVSELMKLIIIIVLARFFSEVRTDRLTLGDLVKVGVITLIPVALILKQPDLGTALVLVPVAVVGAFLAGIEWKHQLIGLVLLAMLIPFGWHMRHHLKPYQQQRIETFLHPEEDQRGAGYQILQSEIAVGSGGFWGKGFGKGSQNQLGFVPVRYSDFILAALAEEQGFIGVCVVLLLVLRPDSAPGGQRAEGQRSRRDVRGDGSYGDSGISRFGQRIDGHRLYAGDWHSPAADELWRLVNGFCIFGFGHGDERPHAAFRQLKPALRIDVFSSRAAASPPAGNF